MNSKPELKVNVSTEILYCVQVKYCKKVVDKYLISQ